MTVKKLQCHIAWSPNRHL